MGLFSKICSEIRYILTARRMLKAVKDISADSKNLTPDDLEKSVDKFAGYLAFITDDRQWTYAQFDAYANQVAHWALAEGYKPGDTAAIFARNRLEYVALWHGLSKVGIIPALLNFNLRAKALAHCINISNTKFAIVDGDLIGAWRSAQKQTLDDIKTYAAFTPVKGLPDFGALVETQPQTRPSRKYRENIRGRDVLMKMFTSGTTGLPKAAIIAHTRGQLYLRGFIEAARTGPSDRVMMVLPLYHATGGLCGVGMALMRGGAIIVREKFSASEFWKECAEYKATLLMYVGELCRFLLSAKETEIEKQNTIRCIVGNGLSRDIWTDFTERFNIDSVVEFYGATEGNISLINVNGPVGAVGRIPPYLRDKLNGDIVRFDVETGQHPRSSNGFLIRTEPGEIGELIGEIRSDSARFRYDGYQDKRASEKKILHDVFKKGDAWFRTGDLMWRDEDHYYYFSDRIGDTFRWRAENVSTGEVSAALTDFDGVHQANVYGVEIPGYDGRAGMAALVADADIDMAALHAHVDQALPPYARPVFLRISTEAETTSTFKYKKTNLVKQGYNPAKITDSLFFDHAEHGYVPLTPAMYKDIQAQKLKL